MSGQYIPQYLDEPEKILFWDFEEFGLFLFLFLVGLILSKAAMGMVVGLVAAAFYRQFLKKHGRDALLKFAYWYVPVLFVRSDCFHDATIRIWRG